MTPFKVTFLETLRSGKPFVQVVCEDGTVLGDSLNDNAHQEDFYRYHDIFHFSLYAHGLFEFNKAHFKPGILEEILVAREVIAHGLAQEHPSVLHQG